MTNIKTRHIPEDYKEYKITNQYAVYTNTEQPHNPRAMFFIGRQSKPAWNYRFANVVTMNHRIEQTILNIQNYEERKAKHKLERIESRRNMNVSGIQIGDIYHWFGGYNCTRNSYIKVLAVAGKNKFKVAELMKYQVDGDWMNGNVAPVIDSNKEELIVKAVPSYDGKVILRDTRANAYHANYYKWNGKPNWENCD